MIKRILRNTVKKLFKVKVIGDIQITSDKTIIIVNHQSFVDGLILGFVLPFKPVFIINKGIANKPFLKQFLKLIDHVTIDPSNPMAMKTIVRLIESGRPVVIFPEGRITTTGSLMKIYNGSAFMAVKTNAEIIPVVIEGGTFSLLSRMDNHHQKLFPEITITYCKPTKLVVSGETTKEKVIESGKNMRHLMQKCIFESRKETDIFEAFIDVMNTYGKTRRIVEDIKEKEYSYKELLKMSIGLGTLASKFTQESENVGILMPTAVPTLALVLGMIYSRRVPAMLNFTAGIDGLQSSCMAAKIETIITSRTFIEQAKLDEKINALENVRIVYIEDMKESITLKDKVAILKGMICVYAKNYVPQKSNDIAVILFTSGSEGKPKGVVLSHQSIMANINQLRSVVDFSIEDKMLNALPIFHSFGLTAGTLLPLLSGMHVFLYPSPLHYKVIPELIYDRSCTILLGTNTFLSNYGKQANVYDFYKLRYVIAGAEKLSDIVRYDWFEKFGLRIFEGYGATETSPVIAVNTPMAYKSGTVGQILPGMEMKLVEVPGVNGGILHVKGPNVMMGYYRHDNPCVLEEPKSEFGDGWYNTGDIVSLDKSNFVKIEGRVKRFAKVAGEMISLESVEKLASITSPGFMHATVAQPDEARGEMIILMTTDPDLTRDKLQSVAKENGYSEISVPRKIKVIKEIPLLGTGKVDYITLKEII